MLVIPKQAVTYPMWNPFRRKSVPAARSRDQIRAEILDRYESVGRMIAARFSRGNVNIAAGRFVTGRDLEMRKAGSRIE